MFCGSAFIISQKKYPGRDSASDRTFSVENFTKLMVMSLMAGDENKAVEYLTRARELDYDTAERYRRERSSQLYSGYKHLMVLRAQQFLGMRPPMTDMAGASTRADWSRAVSSVSSAMSTALAYLPRGDPELHSWYGTVLVHHANAFPNQPEKTRILRDAVTSFHTALALDPQFRPAIDSLVQLGYGCKNCGGRGTCPECRGAGTCSKCKGSGETKSRFRSESKRCDQCSGSGRCSKCGGSRFCRVCNGWRLARAGT